MRRLAISLIALTAAYPAFADDIFTQAPISAVTVYPRGAELSLRATVELPAGSHRIYLPYSGLSDLTALPRIRTSEGVTIGALGLRPDMSVDPAMLFTPAQAKAKAALDAAEDGLAEADDALAVARTEVQALEARLDFLAKVAPGDGAGIDEILAMADTLQTETAATRGALVATRARLRPLTEARDKAAEAHDAAQAAFDRLGPPGATADMLAVDVSVAQAGPVSLELTKLAPHAGWQMDYDLDLDREAGQLGIARKLIVHQQTGQVWHGVALTLSTARPGEAVGPSETNPDQARIEEPYEDNGYGGDMARSAAPMAEMAPEPMVALDDAKMTTAEMQVDGLALSYVYPDPVTIAAGEAAELALDTLTLTAEPAIHASPRWDDTAFTVASFTNDTGQPILPGSANILRDGHLVGREQIDMIPAGAETTLPFGPIDGIRLDTVFARNAEGDTGIITRSNTREQNITFSVENLTGEAQSLRAFYPLTFSEQEDLRVKVTATPAPDETDIDHKRGVSAWDMTLAPGETREVSIKVELGWPDGKELRWYP